MRWQPLRTMQRAVAWVAGPHTIHICIVQCDMTAVSVKHNSSTAVLSRRRGTCCHAYLATQCQATSSHTK